MAQIIASSGSPHSTAIAAGLIAEFGSLPAALAASRRRLAVIKGMDRTTIDALKWFEGAMRHALKRTVSDSPVIANWQALLDYLHAEMAHLPIECLRVLHLNTRNMLIRDEVMDEGTIDNTTVHVREVIRRCLELGSAAIILVHNHPSGNPGPSSHDIQITRGLYDTAQRLGIALHDHIIIGTQGHVSLKAQGLF